jgi:hypothetical protein
MAKTYVKKTRTGSNASYTMTLAHDYSDKQHQEMLNLHGPVEVELGGTLDAVLTLVTPYTACTIGWGVYADAGGVTRKGTVVFDDGTNIIVTPWGAATFAAGNTIYVGVIGSGVYTARTISTVVNSFAISSNVKDFPDNFPVNQAFTYDTELNYATAVNKAEAWGTWACAKIALALQARWTLTSALSFEDYDTIEIIST